MLSVAGGRRPFLEGLEPREITPETLRWTPILIVLFAAVFRLVFLAIKPPHFDEGVNGWFIDQMTRTGYYHYDPSNYHGPLHFYLLFFFERLLGRNLWAIRLPIVIVSTLTVWLVAKFDRFLDRRTCWFAAFAMAVSPGAEFYGRYAIHESEQVLFLILAIWGFAGLWRIGERNYLWAAAMGVTGMVLTKETYAIHLVAFGLAGVCMFALEKIMHDGPFTPVKQVWTRRDLECVLAVSAGLLIFFYSGTLIDPIFYEARDVLVPRLGWHLRIPEFLVNTTWQPFAEWFKTGQEGHGHEKTAYDLVLATIGKKSLVVNYYWLALMWRYEWPALLGLIASPLYLLPKSNRLIRYLAIYGCGALAAYSIIHYKTPWCIITIVWPFFFVFGDLVTKLVEKTGRAAAFSLAGVLLAASLAWSVRLNFYHYTDENEPYVYVQTFNDLNKLTGPLFKLVAQDPSNYQMSGNIILPSYHPLPWVLGDFTHIGYYDDNRAPDKMDADFLLVDQSREEEVEKALKESYFTGDFRLRNSMDPSKLYLNTKKFGVLYPNRKPEFTPRP